jgi:hypothetical protein
VRAEVIRVLHKATFGMPTLSVNDPAGQPLSVAEQRCIDAAEQDDLELLNALLAIEHEMVEHEFAALERLLFYCQFADGELDERVMALPDRAFLDAMGDQTSLGWSYVGPNETA